jgi:alcohol dehydrogenase YqhD (iron-dependent ADH family)
LDKTVDYLKEAGMEVSLFEGVEPDPSVETAMKGVEAMRTFNLDWFSPISSFHELSWCNVSHLSIYV